MSEPAVLREDAGLGRSAEQEQFGAALHELLSGADVPGAARAWAAGDRAPGHAVWHQLAGLGVTGLAVPEARLEIRPACPSPHSVRVRALRGNFLRRPGLTRGPDPDGGDSWLRT